MIFKNMAFFLVALSLHRGMWAICCGTQAFSSGSTWGASLALHRLSDPEAYGILFPQPGIKSASPLLEGGFLTIGPIGKSQKKNVLIFLKV